MKREKAIEKMLMPQSSVRSFKHLNSLFEFLPCNVCSVQCPVKIQKLINLNVRCHFVRACLQSDDEKTFVPNLFGPDLDIRHLLDKREWTSG